MEKVKNKRIMVYSKDFKLFILAFLWWILQLLLKS